MTPAAVCSVFMNRVALLTEHPVGDSLIGVVPGAERNYRLSLDPPMNCLFVGVSE